MDTLSKQSTVSALKCTVKAGGAGVKRKRSELSLQSCTPSRPGSSDGTSLHASDIENIEKQLKCGKSVVDILVATGVCLPLDADCTGWTAPTLLAYVRACLPPVPRLISKARSHTTDSIKCLDDLLHVMEQAKHIVVIAGAGISVSCGIPDFRSPTTGLYDILRSTNCSGLKHVSEPQELFDYHIFCENPALFYSAAPLLYRVAADVAPSQSHKFLAQLEKKCHIQRIYTQNIDDLEHKAGVKRVVQCHGTLGTLSCLKCGRQHAAEAFMSELTKGQVPICGNTRCKGVLKPDAVFFRQSLPAEFEGRYPVDIAECDLLIVMGSSLKVQPIANAINLIKPTTPAVLINKESISRHKWDLELLGDSDVICRYLMASKPLADSAAEGGCTDVVVKRDDINPERWHFESSSPPERPVVREWQKLLPGGGEGSNPPEQKVSRSGRTIRHRKAPDGEAYDLIEA